MDVNYIANLVGPEFDKAWDEIWNTGLNDDEMGKALDAHADLIISAYNVFVEHLNKFCEMSDVPKDWFDYTDNSWTSLGIVDELSEFTDAVGRKLYKLVNINMEKENNPFYIEDEDVKSYANEYVPHSMRYFQKQHESFESWDSDEKYEFDIYIHQTTVMEDSYYGYMCLPLKDGRYWLVYYEC